MVVMNQLKESIVTSRPFKIKMLLVSILALSGCSSMPQSSDHEKTVQAESASKVAEKVEIQKKPIAPETLYDLLLAEMGGKNNRLEIALGNYMRQAHMTKDPAVIERYARIANYMQAHQATLDATQLWLDADPDNIDALHLMLAHQISQGTAESQELALRNLLQQTKDLNILLIEQQLNASSDIQRQAFQKTLSNILKEQNSDYTKEYELWYLKAKSESLLGQYDKVIADAEQTQSLKSDFLPAYVLIVDAYEKTNQIDLALKNLEKLTKMDKDNKKVRIYYARLLIKTEKFEKAKDEFKDLEKIFPEDLDIKLTYGVLCAETGDQKEALDIFQELIDQGYRSDEALIQTAILQEKNDEVAEAINTLLEVQPSPFYQEARFKAATLMSNTDIGKALDILDEGAQVQPDAELLYSVFTTELLAKQNQKEKALQFISKKIGANPEAPSLLYTRAMLLTELQQNTEAEKDLRSVLKVNANNLAALNALGYLLANENKKLEEAETFLKKALQLSPNDPPIMDSMGWLEYRKGNLNEALEYLEKAYAQLKDHEIAAHLGEVLWKLDQQEKAKQIWQEGLKVNPESKVLKDTMQRFM